MGQPLNRSRTSILPYIPSLSCCITRAFKNGKSVRIPGDLAYERADIDLEIERVEDEIRIRPARRSLARVLAKFARFSSDFMAEGRGDQEQADRDSIFMRR